MSVCLSLAWTSVSLPDTLDGGQLSISSPGYVPMQIGPLAASDQLTNTPAAPRRRRRLHGVCGGARPFRASSRSVAEDAGGGGVGGGDEVYWSLQPIDDAMSMSVIGQLSSPDNQIVG